MSIARYRILRRLGQGGMAEVFEAELAGELGFSRKVAIKRMLASAAADPGAGQRFLDEARIASKLHHANVVAIVDLGLLDGLPFMVLELVDGTNAQQLLQRAGGRLPIEVTLAIAADVAHALDHAHTALDPAGLALGIVHRDVKPSNVLVSWGGDVKLSDFGIAVARDRTSQTEAGLIAGTAGFIAPEQRQRLPLDGRTDVFALGLTIHALATGTTPLADVEVELRALAGEAIPVDPTLPDDIRALIAHTLAISRTDRPTAGELADALGAALAPRLTRDPKSLLRNYLAGLERRPSARPGALDALLGIEVVRTDSDSADTGVHHYATRAAPDLVPTVRDPEQIVVAPRRRRGPVIAAIAGLAVVAIATWRLVAPAAVVARIDAGIVVAQLDAAVAREAAVPADAVGGDADAVAVAGDAAAVVAHADARVGRPRDAGVIAIADAVVARPTGTGYLQVLGEDLVGAAVIVDGVQLGSVPNPIAVAIGVHRVEVLRRDGTRLPAKTVEIKPVHVRSSPLTPTW